MTDVRLPLAVAADHPAYAGHFPGQPILPGVVLLDEVLHALAAQQGLEAAVGRIKSAKFPSPVQPGQALCLNYAATAPGVFRFAVMAGERLAAGGVITFAATGLGAETA
jgi:3-hydroxymyristoyl/3-hydroxydecanoyl-(acyl carrier protein) dehydratase